MAKAKAMTTRAEGIKRMVWTPVSIPTLYVEAVTAGVSLIADARYKY